MIQTVVPLIDDSRAVIYNHNMFIMQAIADGLVSSQTC